MWDSGVRFFCEFLLNVPRRPICFFSAGREFGATCAPPLILLR